MAQGYWFAQTDGVDLLAVGEDYVLVGSPFTALLLDRASGEEVESVNYEDEDDDEDGEDAEDQFLHVRHLTDSREYVLGSLTVRVVAAEGRIEGTSPEKAFVPTGNPLTVGPYTFANDLKELVVTSATGRIWSFDVASPMFDESSAVGFDGWVYVATSSGRLLAVSTDDDSLDQALAAWDPT
jgi:hypothetical protein